VSCGWGARSQDDSISSFEQGCLAVLPSAVTSGRRLAASYDSRYTFYIQHGSLIDGIIKLRARLERALPHIPFPSRRSMHKIFLAIHHSRLGAFCTIFGSLLVVPVVGLSPHSLTIFSPQLDTLHHTFGSAPLHTFHRGQPHESQIVNF